MEAACLLMYVEEKNIEQIDDNNFKYKFSYEEKDKFSLGVKELNNIMLTWRIASITGGVHPFAYVHKCLQENIQIPPRLLGLVTEKFMNNISDDLKKKYPKLAERANALNGNSTTQMIDARINCCLDKQHPNFAPELKIAIEAWNELFNGDQENKKHKVSVKKRLEEYLKHLSLSPSAIKRLATVINPKSRKAGGVIPIEQTK